MFLHIINDDKFINIGIENFRKLSSVNMKTLIIYSSQNFSHLAVSPDFIISSRRWYVDRRFFKPIRSCDVLIFHSLSIYCLVATFLCKKSCKIHWIGWGYDYYNRFVNKGYKLYGPHTAQLISRILTKTTSTALQKFKRKLGDLFFIYAIRRIDYFSPVLPEDFDLFKQYFPKTKMVYMPWNYGITELKSHVIPNTDLPLGPNILVGNSASYTNNHIEVFETLKHIDLGKRKIIVPLSYGDPVYRDYIIEIGKNLFHDSFVPLVDFMPTEDYHEILQSCSIAIMNHYRQQAVGNISVLIQSGAKVYLSERNPFLKTCKRINVKVFLLEELEKDSSSFFNPLTNSEKETNYSHYIAEFNQEKIHRQTRIIIDYLLKKS